MLPFELSSPGYRCRMSNEGQAVRQPPLPRSGVTLLELIVVIALLGLILAVAAPAFIVPAARREPDLSTAIGMARHAAILRGEPVTIAFSKAGDWRIDGDATPTASPIATGKLVASIGALRVRVSPLGTCLSDGIASPVDWNALDCRFGAESAESGPR